MQKEKVVNRWMFPIAAIVMMLCLGNVYSWSIFRTPLMEMHGWSIAAATLPFTISIVVVSIVVIFAGRWQDKVGPKTVAMTGGVLLGVGFLLASQIGTTLPGLYLAYGVMVGAGVGFGYVTPIACLIKWFPDMRGLMTGVAVFGMGAGSLVGAPVGTYINQNYGVYVTFVVFGIALGALVMLCGALLRNPPPGWSPAGWTPPVPAVKAVKVDYSPSEILAYPQTYLLWFIFLMWASIGLMAISQAVPLGMELAGLTPAVAAGALGTMALFNGLGRPAFGWISDRVGRNWAAAIGFALYIVAMLAVLRVATTFAVFVIGLSMIGFSFGGGLTVMPATTADYYGTKHLGMNYGLIYTAWGCAGILGPMIGAWVQATYGSFFPAFWILSILAILGIIAVFITRAPVPKE